jgi:hypothetical protein
MNKEQQELLDEAYKNYKRITHETNEKNHYGEYSKWGDNPLISGVQHLTRGSFIRMIKIDTEFSKKWELKIEERELGLGERHDIKEQYGFDCRKLAKPSIKQLDDANIPTKLITITYKDKTKDNRNLTNESNTNI